MPEQNASNKIAKESAISFFGMGFGDGVRYLFTAVLARFAGVDYLGVYSMANSVTRIGEVLGIAGLQSGVMRFVSRLDKKTERAEIIRLITSGLKVGLIISMIVMLIQILFSRWLAYDLFNGADLLYQILLISAVSIPFATVMTIAAFATQGYQRLKYKIFILHILNPLVMLVFVVFSIEFFTNETAVKYPLLITAVICALVAIVLLKKLTDLKIRRILSVSVDKELLKFSFPLMFVTIIDTLMHWMDILMLGYFTDAHSVGLYHPATRTAGLIRIVLVAFMGIFAPMIAELHRKNQHDEMNRLFKLIVRWVMSLSLPFAIIMLIYNQEIMLLFGKEFVSASNVLIILTSAALLQAFFGANGHILTMTGYPRINLINACLAIVINFILNFIWIPRYGLIGSAYATLVAMGTLGCLRWIEVYHFLQIQPFSFKLLKPLFAGCGMAVILLALKQLTISLHSILSLTTATFAGIVSFLFFLWMLKLDEDDRGIWAGIKMIFPKK